LRCRAVATDFQVACLCKALLERTSDVIPRETIKSAVGSPVEFPVMIYK
jgi:hypothetical protein